MECNVIICCVMLCYAMLCYVMVSIHPSIHPSVRPSIRPSSIHPSTYTYDDGYHSIPLHHFTLFYISFHYITPHHIILHYTIYKPMIIYIHIVDVYHVYKWDDVRNSDSTLTQLQHQLSLHWV